MSHVSYRWVMSLAHDLILLTPTPLVCILHCTLSSSSSHYAPRLCGLTSVLLKYQLIFSMLHFSIHKYMLAEYCLNFAQAWRGGAATCGAICGGAKC